MAARVLLVFRARKSTFPLARTMTSNVLRFPEKKATTDEDEVASTLNGAMEASERGELRGLIQIECRDDGDRISIVGSFAERLEYGGMAALKLMNIIADKIKVNEGAGHSYSPAVREQERRRPTPPGLENTDFGTLR